MTRARLELLRAQTQLNGLDFVAVSADQLELTIHFLLPTPNAAALAAALDGATISGGEAIESVPVRPIQAADWSTVDGLPQLKLHVDAPGDFSIYTLTLHSTPTLLDRFFDHLAFSFKAGCPSTLDCEAPALRCPAGPVDAPVIDYLAKDFLSFKSALLEFSALRYPEWQERSEADFGVMFAEALSSLADDLSYFQDRVAAETSLDTASERRSLVRHSRLVDYEPRPAVAARTLLQLETTASSASVPAGLVVSAQNGEGALIDFETGEGLSDVATYPIAAAWNRITPYYFDDSERCLAAGSTELWLDGSGLGLFVGQQLLLETADAIPGNPPLRQLIRLSEAPEETVDPLVDSASGGRPVTRIRFGEDALLRERDLTRTLVCGNLLPATQGRRNSEAFVLGPDSAGVSRRAVTRTGANGTPQFLYTLASGRLAWLASPSDASARCRPEIRVVVQDSAPSRPYAFRHSLLEAERFDEVFTIDPARYIALGTPGTPSDGWFEYAGDDGDTLRFGDGVFGALPEEGARVLVTFRSGGGAAGNVAADTLTHIAPGSPLATLASVVTNPFAATGGADEESEQSIRIQAPEAFRAQLFRAVRAEDYQAAAEELPWVQRAGTTFRYTGSWLSVFTSADPISSEELSNARHLELIELLDRRRLAGYEAFVPAPRFASLDLEILLCAEATAFRADVELSVREALSSRRKDDGSLGFFHVDRFTFGQSLERSSLEAAIQAVPGVDGVRSIRYRQRGRTSGFVDLPDRLRVGVDQILRVDGELSRPERGSVRVAVEGGK